MNQTTTGNHRETESNFPGAPTDYHGFLRHDFTVDDCPAIVVQPNNPIPDRPWVWRAEFFDAFPLFDLAMLERGCYLAYIQVGNTFGCPSALAHWNVFYEELTGRYGLSPKPILEGLSRGGLYIYNWAAAHPHSVGCLYGDADLSVPWKENTRIVAERYRELGGSIELIPKPGVEHHPHGLDDPTPVVEFALECQ